VSAFILRVEEPGGSRDCSLPCSIGGDSTDVLIVPGTISGERAELLQQGAEFGVRASGAVPLRVNGVPLAAGEFRALQPQDLCSIGSARLVVESLQPDSALLSIRHLAGNATLEPIRTETESSADTFGDDVRIVAAVGDAQAELRVATPAGNKFRWPRRTTAWVGALLLMLLVAMAVLASRLQPVTLVVQPAEADVSVKGIGWRASNTLMMLPGERTVTATLEGYADLQRTVTVREDQALEVSLRLQPLPGILEIDTGGVIARVFVDGAEVGKTSDDIKVAGGERTLTLRADRHLDVIQRIKVTGKGVRQALRIPMQSSWGRLEVSATSSGATIAVDGAAPQALPAVLDVPAGVHRLNVAAPGSKPWQSAVLVRAGETTRVGPVVLGAPDADLRVSSRPTGADVTVGGVFRGRTPLSVALPAGMEHAVGVSLQGYRAAERQVIAESGRRIDLALTLQPVLVRLTVQGDPADAEIWVNGSERGKAPLSIELPARKHLIEARRSGLQTARFEVDLSAAVERRVDYSLIPEGRKADWKPPPSAMKSDSGTLLRLMPTGSFNQGSERREQGRRANEFSRAVTLSRPFYLGTREVTNGEFRRFRPAHASGFIGKRTLDLDGQPVTGVSWSDAVQYCNWLSTTEGLPVAYEQKDGKWVLKQPVPPGYRLPTEAEWEFVARYAGPGMRARRYEWGDALPPPAGFANLAGSEAAAEMPKVLEGWADDYPVVASPGKFAANMLGIFDMTGNVSEWVHDTYASFDAAGGGSDPLGPPSGTRHVIKGSHYKTTSFAELRAAWREGGDTPSQTIGFRVARYAE
jgi:formylglycine-generating enzyme required for sulfatase activity